MACHSFSDTFTDVILIFWQEEPGSSDKSETSPIGVSGVRYALLGCNWFFFKFKDEWKIPQIDYFKMRHTLTHSLPYSFHRPDSLQSICVG